MSHVRMSHVTYWNESCRILRCVYVTYNGLCHIQRGGDETTPQPSLMSTLPHTYTTTHCHALQHTTTHYNTLQHTASHCNIHNTLQNAATRTNTLQHAQHTHHTFPPPLNTISMSISPLPHAYTVTHYNKLQHTTTHCNTLQHTVPHCNTPILLLFIRRGERAFAITVLESCVCVCVCVIVRLCVRLCVCV